MRRRDQLAADAAALRRRQRRRAPRARHRRGARPARRRRAPAGPPRGLRPVRVQAAGLGRPVPEVAVPARGSGSSGCSSARARARRTTSRRAGSCASNDDVAYPNLMFHFLPIAVRYDGSAPASDHGYQVHIGPMYSDARGSVKITSADPSRAPRAALQLPVDRPGPPGVGRGDPRGAGHPQPARVGPVQRRRALARARRRQPTSRSWTGWRSDARDGAASLVHGRMGTDDMSVIDPLTMRVHGLEGLRVVDASVMPYVTNGNIYAPVMMIGREGRRPDPGQHAARRPRRSSSTGT